jgi:acetyltransferase
VGGVLQVGLFGGYALRFAAQLAEEELRTAETLPEIARAAGKPYIVHSLYAPHDTEPIRVLRRARVPVLASLDIACRCAAAVSEWGQNRQRVPVEKRTLTPAPDAFSSAHQAGRSALLEPEARALVARYGIRVVNACVATTAEQARNAAIYNRLPVVMKLIAATIPHKTDAGAVRLGLHTLVDVERAFTELMQIAPDATGVLVSPMLPRPAAEVMVGARRDPQFGPIITIGTGGTNVEAAHDSVIRVLPIDADDARAAIRETTAGRVLANPRGRTPANLEGLVQVMLRLGDCIMANPEISDIELNPVFVDENDAVAVDARAFLLES